MKKTKRVFKFTTVLMSIALVLAAVVAIGIITVGATEGTESGIITVPEIPAINRPYKTIEELGLDFEKIDSYFPQNIEVRYEDGKVYVEDIGVTFVEVYVTNDYVALELIDGYWTAELGAEPMFVCVEYYEDSKEEGYLRANYHGNGTRDPYIVFDDRIKDTYVNFSYEYGNVIVQYDSGDYYYEDRYTNGVLDEHIVSNRHDDELVNDAIYSVNGSLAYGRLYTDTYYYYFPGQGWSSTWGEFEAGDTPEGYEDIDETYFTANKPSLICSEAEGDDLLHDVEKAFCTTLATCKNGCGHTEGTIEHHDWQIVDGKKECSICDAVFFPEFEYVDRIYPTVEETGFPYAEYRALFPEVLTVKYENGKYMIKDVGADRAEASSTGGYIDIPLVDGWWIYELDEEIYNDESIDIFVTFRGELDGMLWNLNYCDGEINGSIYMESKEASLSVRVYYAEYDWVCFMYYVGGRRYTDGYTNGVFSSQEVITRYGDDELNIDYYADGTVESIYIYIDGYWSYYYPDRGWQNGNGEAINAPEGYENADVEFFASIVPTTINCAHENYGEADCTNPERCLICGIAKEGSEPLGHNMADATCTEPSICTVCGETEGEPLGHNMHATVTEATCEENGYITDFCTKCGYSVESEEIHALGHKWTDATYDSPKTCEKCGVTEGKPLIRPDASDTTSGENTTDVVDKAPGNNNENDDEDEEKKGCGSVIGIGSMAVIAVVGGVNIIKKRREDID